MSYSNRQPDLLVMDVSGSGQVSLSLGSTPRITAGIQKLAQRFLLALLTPQGSFKSDPAYGTSFVLDIGKTNVTGNIENAFVSAVSDIKAWMKSVDAQYDTPEDEQLVDAQLETFNSSDDKVNLTIRLTSAAGESRSYLAPISIVAK